MISVRSYGADLGELAWPVLGTTAFALFAALLLRFSRVSPWRQRALPQEGKKKPKGKQATELHDFVYDSPLQEEKTPKTKRAKKTPDLVYDVDSFPQVLQDFVYDSLPQSSEAASHAIRLLRIHSGDADTQLSCSLETFNFDICPEYWALSYTWGPETPSHIVLVNDQRFRIRQNLFNFLTVFRSPKSDDFYLWIDQICINQENIPERNSQVRRMGQYYDRATSVITWLGIGTELELAAMARIKQVDVENTPPAEYKEPMTLDLLRGYRSIITNSYFERLWIVQEMARAKTLLVVLGTETLTPVTASWRHFNFAFVQLLFERTIISTTPAAAQQELGLRQDIRDRGGILFQLLEVKKHHDAADIFELIEAFSGHNCADPRDKLYALQDIGHLQKQLFTIDYSKNKHRVYLDFVTACLNSSETGRTLSERQFDILMRLGQTMGIKVEVREQIAHAKDKSGPNAADTVQAGATDLVLLKESLGKLRDSIDYVGSRDVLFFGPRYDEKTGHRVSPLSKEAFRGRIPTTFRVPASVNMAEISRIAQQDLLRRAGVDIQAQSLADSGEGALADAVGEPSASGGYITIVCLSGDISYMGLPPLDTGE